MPMNRYTIGDWLGFATIFIVVFVVCLVSELAAFLYVNQFFT